MVIGLGLDSLSAAVGSKGGINLARIRFTEEDADDWQGILGFQIGVFCSIKIKNRLFIQPEVFYVNKGVSLKGTYLGEELKSIVKFTYIEVPLLLKCVLSSEDRAFQPAVFFGVYRAFKINTKSIMEYEGDRVEEDITDQVKKKDDGIVLGISADWKMGKGKLVMDLRYNLGIKNIRKETTFEGYEVKHKALSFMVGYSF